MRQNYLFAVCFTLIITAVIFIFYFRFSFRSNNIPLQVKPHVQEFVTQAKERGITVDTTNLKINFVSGLKDEENNPVFGKYTHWSFPLSLDIIKLDTTGYWWRGSINRDSKDYINYSREKVIFHELGHFLLNRREHKFDTFPGGLPKSIMGTASIPSYEQYPDLRKYYIDELFNQNTPAPNWVINEKCTTVTRGNQELNKISKVSNEVIFRSFWEGPSEVFSADYIIIQLNKKVDESMLKKIALSLREERECYNFLTISYYIPKQNSNTLPWATTNFTPELEVKIMGSTYEEDY